MRRYSQLKITSGGMVANLVETLASMYSVRRYERTLLHAYLLSYSTVPLYTVMEGQYILYSGIYCTMHRYVLYVDQYYYCTAWHSVSGS